MLGPLGVTMLCLAPAAGSSSALRAPATFTLGEAHVRLLRHAIVLWAPVESGAPAVLLSPVQLEEEAGPRLAADVAARAGLPWSNPPRPAEAQAVETLIAEMPEALQQALVHGRLASGPQSYDNPLLALPAMAQQLPPEIAALATARSVRFDFTDAHATLLRNARWSGLFMNPKRPYGDMTYFELDMAEILREPIQRDADGALPHAQEERLGKLHAETLPALQLFLQKAEIPLGTYPMIPLEASLFGG